MKEEAAFNWSYSRGPRASPVTVSSCEWYRMMNDAPRDTTAEHIVSPLLAQRVQPQFQIATAKSKNPSNPPMCRFYVKTSDLTILPNYHIINWHSGQDNMTIGHHGPYQKLLGVLIVSNCRGGGRHTLICVELSLGHLD